ncbi:MAG: flagellar basal-body rod protein FlgF [Spirochaetaceae bacterium]|nr:MAG: flagellar basal-body rod protein FlgF [Spirochaetaceae bacterium]
MVRGMYTAASGMTAQQHRLDALTNNLANVDTTGFKRDQAVYKAFPELLLRRMSDDGVLRIPYRAQMPWGSIDKAPVVGRLGTGVELNEIYTVFEQGSFKESGNPFDLALEGHGFFVVETPTGERLTRNGSFHVDPSGYLVTKDGFPVLGEEGRIRVTMNNFVVDEDGRVFANDVYRDPDRLVSMIENQWDETVELDRLRLVEVPNDRYLEKQGSSLWRTTWDSGDAEIAVEGFRPRVHQGFLETANVNPVTEMVEMIEVNRAYEANQKVIQTQDATTGKLINEVLRM